VRTPVKIRESLGGRRLPESWIPPRHTLDLRARARLRQMLGSGGEWQQRIPAVLYHHGGPQHSHLITSEGSCWHARSTAARRGARADPDRVERD